MEKRIRRKRYTSRPYPVKKPVSNPAIMENRHDVLIIDNDTELDANLSESEPGQSSKNTISTNVGHTNDEMLELLREIRKTQCTKDDFTKYEKAISKQFSAVENRISSNTTSIETMEVRLKNVEESLEASKYDAEIAKQNLLSRNLSIVGIPMMENENLRALIVKLGTLVDCQVKNSDIFGTYRVHYGNKPTDIIIAKINDLRIKHEFLKKKAMKQLRVNDILEKPTNNNSFIYINNHVTPFFGRLLAEGRRIVKDYKFHSVRLTKTGCQIRLDDGGTDQIYRSVDELRKLAAVHGRDSDKKHKRTRSDDDDVITDSRSLKTKK